MIHLYLIARGTYSDELQREHNTRFIYCTSSILYVIKKKMSYSDFFQRKYCKAQQKQLKFSK